MISFRPVTTVVACLVLVAAHTACTSAPTNQGPGNPEVDVYRHGGLEGSGPEAPSSTSRDGDPPGDRSAVAPGEFVAHGQAGPPIDGERAARLLELIGELATPPFGTGAVLSVSVDGTTATFTAGKLHEGGPALNPDSMFNWASVSKVVTAAKVLELANQKRIHLDDPVAIHLPDVSLYDDKQVDRASDITIRQLLMHRGGLPHQPASLDPGAVGSDWMDPELLQKLTRTLEVRLAREPGEYGYSNLGYALAAAIVERKEKRTFAEIMEGFLPSMKMRNSTYWPANLHENAAHGRVQQGEAVQFHQPSWYASRYSLPYSGLWASAPDLVRFGNALITAAADETAALHPMTAFERGHGPGPYRGKRLGSPSLEHDGASPGFLSWFAAVPEKKLVLALVCNGSNESREQLQRFVPIIEEIVQIVGSVSEPTTATTTLP